MTDKLKRALLHPSRLALFLLHKTAVLWPDKQFLQLKFRLKMGRKLNLKNPKTFSEKLQWLKLYNRKPEYTTMVDKFAVKEYVAKKIGEEYIIPTLGVWNTPEEIEWDKLPNQFVLKTTHGGGSGGVVICKDKASFDIKAVKQKLQKSLNSDIYQSFREWPYKNVPKRIIAEQYINNGENKDLCDYKFFCFGGEPKLCQVIAGRGSLMTVDFYDKEWKHQPFHEPKGYPFSKNGHAKPRSIELMWNLASILSAGQPFLRVDFYEVDDKVLFGELTFFPTSGMGGFDPEEWDETFGRWIKLS